MNHRKKLARLLAALLIFALGFSVLFVALETDHDCDGEDCAICAALGACEAVLHQLAMAALALVAARFLCRAGLTIAREAAMAFCRPTLIRLKVKLSD